LTIARELIASAKIIRCPGVYGSDWAIHDSGEHSVRLDIGELDAAVTVTAREVVG
jgi:hypothetical protein